MKFEQPTGLSGLAGQSALWAGTSPARGETQNAGYRSSASMKNARWGRTNRAF